jgi:hypothetical protein
MQMLPVWQSTLLLTEASDWIGFIVGPENQLHLCRLRGFPNRLHKNVEFPFRSAPHKHVPLAGGGVATFFDRTCCFFDPPQSKTDSTFRMADVVRLGDVVESIHENPVDGSFLLVTKTSITFYRKAATLSNFVSRFIAETVPTIRTEELQQVLPSELVDSVALFCIHNTYFKSTTNKT